MPATPAAAPAEQFDMVFHVQVRATRAQSLACPAPMCVRNHDYNGVGNDVGSASFLARSDVRAARTGRGRGLDWGDHWLMLTYRTTRGPRPRQLPPLPLSRGNVGESTGC